MSTLGGPLENYLHINPNQAWPPIFLNYDPTQYLTIINKREHTLQKKKHNLIWRSRPRPEWASTTWWNCWPRNSLLVKFIYSEKATKFCEIFPLLLSTVHTDKSKGKISQHFVAFSEYMNFKTKHVEVANLINDDVTFFAFLSAGE